MKTPKLSIRFLLLVYAFFDNKNNKCIANDMIDSSITY